MAPAWRRRGRAWRRSGKSVTHGFDEEGGARVGVRGAAGLGMSGGGRPVGETPSPRLDNEWQHWGNIPAGVKEIGDDGEGCGGPVVAAASARPAGLPRRRTARSFWKQRKEALVADEASARASPPSSNPSGSRNPRARRGRRKANSYWSCRFSASKGQKAKEVEDTGFKLWYTGTTSNKNGVGILVNKSLRDGVVDVKRQGDRMILVKLVVGDLVLNVISAYAPQVGHNESTKREFWEGLEDFVRRVPIGEKLFIGGDLNGHVGTSNTGFERVHGGFGYGIKNQEGEDVLSFALAYDMIVANTLFRKRESDLVTFSSGLHSSQIDFVLSRREDRRVCIDCKVIPGESVVPQHKLVVVDFRFRIRVQRGKRAKVARTKWWKLKGEASQAFRERVIKEGPWEEGGDANMMWTSMATCLRKVAV
ncbi:hypothetical protein QYE76_039412 [Lolium multiflorum]|uniref:Craniofacial development protein 2-like n=1 Tax=Lolium multiflorum TaxID=4521 RepID=A0AAD8T9M5_LOLMU|nr:hypothetical protein QYE76_039412 [Lolium multiflorum]